MPVGSVMTSLSFSCPRGTVLGLSLAVAIASIHSTARAAVGAPQRDNARPGETSGPSTQIEIEVDVAKSIAESEDIRRWVGQRAQSVVDTLPAGSSHRGVVRVTLSGALYDYQVEIQAMRGRKAVGAPITWPCECSSEELLDKLSETLPEVVGHLEVVDDPQPLPAPTVVEAPVEVDGGERSERLGPAGAAGVVLVSVGVAGVGAGVALWLLGTDVDPVPGRQFERRDYRPFGPPTVATGGGLLLTGAVLLLLRKRLHRRPGDASLSFRLPSSRSRQPAALQISGRF